MWNQERRNGSLAADMGEGDPKKPRGNMSLYTYFVQTYCEEHKKKHPDSSVNYILDFAEKVKLSAT